MKFIIVFLAFSFLVLGVFLYQEVTFDVDRVVAATTVKTEGADANVERDQQSNSAETIPLQDYKVTLSRPLFSPERRPEEKQEISKKPEGSKVEKSVGSADKLKLSATIITSEVKEAIFTKERNRDSIKVKEGDTFGTWSVSKIEEDRVVLSSGEKNREILLRVYQPVVKRKKVTQRRVARSSNSAKPTSDSRKAVSLLKRAPDSTH